MPCMTNAIPATRADSLTICRQIQAQPELLAQAHAQLDLATVLDLLYGDISPVLHASACTASAQSVAWA